MNVRSTVEFLPLILHLIPTSHQSHHRPSPVCRDSAHPPSSHNSQSSHNCTALLHPLPQCEESYQKIAILSVISRPSDHISAARRYIPDNRLGTGPPKNPEQSLHLGKYIDNIIGDSGDGNKGNDGDWH